MALFTFCRFLEEIWDIMGIFEELQNRNQGRRRSESCHDDWDQSSPVLWGASRSKTRLWHVRLLIDHCHGTVIKRTIGEWNQMETDILYVDDFTLLSSTAEEKLNQLDGTISGKKNRSKDQCREDQSFKVCSWKTGSTKYWREWSGWYGQLCISWCLSW